MNFKASWNHGPGKEVEIGVGLLREDTGKALVVAMDHGLLGAPEGFKNPGSTLKRVLEGGPDALLVTPNFARYFRELLASRPGLKTIVRVDFLATSTIPGGVGMEIQDVFSNVEEAIRVGADAIAAFLVFGREDPEIFANNIKYIAALSREAHQRGIPLVVETVFWGRKAAELVPEEEARLLESACRMAFELGADVIKAPYPKDRRAFSQIAENCPVPILILGGPKTHTEEEVLKQVKNAMEDGARGVIFGRNVWQARSPEKMVRALGRIIHGGASVEEALALLE